MGIETMNPTAAQISQATKSGTVYHTKEALEYILDYQHPVYAAENKIYSETVLRSLLDDSNPVIITRGKYPDLGGGSRDGGHAMVIIHYYYDSSKSDYVYVVLNPEPVNVGSVERKTYSEICRETEQDIIHIWDGIVVYQKGNYANTIDWQGFFQ